MSKKSVQERSKACGADTMSTVAVPLQREQDAPYSEGYRPIIGLPIPIQQGQHGPLLLADAVGAWAIERMQGRVLFVPLWPFPTHTHVYQSLWPLIASMDGLLLPAAPPGEDWYTSWQARESHPDPHTWSLSWEIALAQLATFLGMPLLAIGDGAEKWNIALGGTQQITNLFPRTIPPSLEHWEHRVLRVHPKSTLQQLFTQQDVQQAWTLPLTTSTRGEHLAEGLRPCADGEDGVVMAFERQDPSFGLGILARLDWGLDQAYGTRIFDAFFQACCSFAVARQRDKTLEASRDVICATVYERVTQGHSLLPIPSSLSQGKIPRSTRKPGTRILHQEHPTLKAVRERKWQRLNVAMR